MKLDMSMTLTSRDKKLLYWMGLVLLLAFFVMFLIEPLLETSALRKAELAEAEAQVQQVQDELAALPELTARRDTLTNHKNELAAGLSPVLSAPQVDTAITSLVMSHGLEPSDLAIGTPVTAALSPFGGGDAAGGSEALQMVSVTFAGSGSAARVMELLRDIGDNYPNIRMVSFNTTGGGVEMTADTLSSDTPLDYNFSVEFYMCA